MGKASEATSQRGRLQNGRDKGHRQRMLQRGEEAFKSRSESCPRMKTRGHRDLRSHQKGHRNVYYIEKRERKKRFSKLYFRDLKKSPTWNAKHMPCLLYL